jgi:hypothetical protein
MAPFSRGTVRLADAAPDAAPLIDPRYYSDGRDVDALVAGLRAARELGTASAFDPWRGEEAQPGSDVQSDDELRGYIRRSLRSYHHYAGTCRIGTDNEAVLDIDLRVRALSGVGQHQRRRLRHRGTGSRAHPVLTPGGARAAQSHPGPRLTRVRPACVPETERA